MPNDPVVAPLPSQQLDDLVVAFIECRIQHVAVVSALRVDVGALTEQQLNDLVVAFTRCRM
jgi:hypothetical protein